MNNLGQKLATSSTTPESFPPLLEALRGLIAQVGREVVRYVNALQVQTYRQIGQHIVEFEQGSAALAAYGQGAAWSRWRHS